MSVLSRFLTAFLVGALLALLFAFAPPARSQSPADWKCYPSQVLFVPIPGGTGSPVLYETIEQGTYAGWKCRDGTIVFKAAQAGFSGPSFNEIMSLSRTYPTAASAAEALWHKYDSPPDLSTPEKAAAWKTLGATATEKLNAIQFGPDYVVAKNASYPTRPTYPFTNGVRGTTKNGAVPVLTTICDCSLGKMSLEGSIRYCSVNPTSVAVCVSKP